MSPLWRDEIAVYLAPHKVVLARRTRGVKPRVVATTELAVEGGAGTDFARVRARLGEALAEPTWQDAIARVVIADQPWVRYGVVPWPPARLDAQARLMHARYVLADAFDDEVSAWAVTLADTPPGQSCVACAMPAMMYTALKETFSGAQVAITSLLPQLIVSFNAWRHQLPAGDVWFASLDEASLAAVHLRDGAWDRVHMARVPADFRVELERLKAFGRLTREAGDGGRVFVDAPAWMRREPPPEGISWLEDEDADGQGHELALLQRMYA